LEPLIVSAAVASAVLAYYIMRKPRWRAIIVAVAGYHRFHLDLLRRDRNLDAESREIALSMLMVLEKQFAGDLKGSPGLLGIVTGIAGDKSTMASLNRLADRICREMAFTGISDIDGRIAKLFITMISMIYRYHLLTSVLGPVAVLYMDMVLILASAGIDRRGSSRMYRDMAR